MRTAATVTSMGVGGLGRSIILNSGVTAPSFGVPGLNDVGIMHSKGVPFKFGSESAHDLLFFTNGYNNTRMTITGDGNVGIGTAAPGSKFVLSANAANPLSPNPANPSVLAPQDGRFYTSSTPTRETRRDDDSSQQRGRGYRSARGRHWTPGGHAGRDAIA